jgi:hypothetical protein
MGHGDLLVTQTYLSPQATTVLRASRVASAAGRLGSNGVLGDHRQCPRTVLPGDERDFFPVACALGRCPWNRFRGSKASRPCALDVVGDVFLIHRRRNPLFREQE